ncbi:mechanosensitive ion channel [Lusitaniella coriacea LEGE 07157]|uniref:Mechanosensitive ion channel n=1 Tax=Lusitaniella coriacea LEGE 07157 TaxID=945747 RepID=A0A8J7DX47_9CYAN|nr:mechanosensitive ion channel [Lusitaniella coriacea]MBE9116806.1 mechanosensitive ion channel [Lusitaniella coriacea LEGE 07157]
MDITSAIAHLRSPLILGQVEVTQIVSNLEADLGTSLLNLGKAVLILLIGWLIALLAKGLIQGLLNRTNVDNKVAGWVTGQQEGEKLPEIEKWIAGAVYWIILLFTIIAALEALQLRQVSGPLQSLLDRVTSFLPQLGGAAVLLGVAWLLATLVKLLVTRVMRTFRLEERLGQQIGESSTGTRLSLTDTIANTLYWFVFLLFLLPILESLGLDAALQPLLGLLNEILAILPNIFGAILIGAVGWLVAQVIRRVVTNFLAATGTDSVGAKFGISGATQQQSLSWIIGTVAYVLVLIPVAIAALNALQIEAISEPAIAMLNQILAALPKIALAALILVVGYVAGKYISEFVTSILTGLGFNNIFQWLGFSSTPYSRPVDRIQTPPTPTTSTETFTIPTTSPGISDTPTSPTTSPGISDTPTSPSIQTRTPSEIVGIVVQVGIVLVATLAAVEKLDFEALALLVAGILAIAAQVLVGIVVLAIGLYVANLAYNLITSSGNRQAQILAQTARISIIAFAIAMALQRMGIAPDIVNLAFGLLLGAIAVAIAISFGLGGRDIAAQQTREWLESFKRRN